MTQGQVEKSYAVICLHCRQPIPISNDVAERHHRQTAHLREQKCQVFHLRCMNCGKEKPYRISEIVEMDETSQEQPSSWNWQQPLTRSAAGH